MSTQPTETAKQQTVESIHIGGKDRPVFFNQMTLEVFLKYVKMEAGKVIDASLIYASLYAPLYTGYYVANQDRDFDFKQVCAWADELYDLGKSDEIKQVCDAFAESKPYKKWLNDIVDVEKIVTKKVIGNKGKKRK